MFLFIINATDKIVDFTCSHIDKAIGTGKAAFDSTEEFLEYGGRRMYIELKGEDPVTKKIDVEFTKLEHKATQKFLSFKDFIETRVEPFVNDVFRKVKRALKM